MEIIFMNTENSKSNESQKFGLNLSQRLLHKHLLHVENFNKTV